MCSFSVAGVGRKSETLTILEEERGELKLHLIVRHIVSPVSPLSLSLLREMGLWVPLGQRNAAKIDAALPRNTHTATTLRPSPAQPPARTHGSSAVPLPARFPPHERAMRAAAAALFCALVALAGLVVVTGAAATEAAAGSAADKCFCQVSHRTGVER